MITVVRSVDQITLLPPATELDSATNATPELTCVKTISEDDSVLAGDALCVTSADPAFVSTHRSVVWKIRADNSDAFDTLPDLDFDQYISSSGFSRVYQLEEVDAAIPDTVAIFSTVLTLA
jgi:hypothetical protein